VLDGHRGRYRGFAGAGKLKLPFRRCDCAFQRWRNFAVDRQLVAALCVRAAVSYGPLKACPRILLQALRHIGMLACCSAPSGI